MLLRQTQLTPKMRLTSSGASDLLRPSSYTPVLLRVGLAIAVFAW